MVQKSIPVDLDNDFSFLGVNSVTLMPLRFPDGVQSRSDVYGFAVEYGILSFSAYHEISRDIKRSI